MKLKKFYYEWRRRIEEKRIQRCDSKIMRWSSIKEYNHMIGNEFTAKEAHHKICFYDLKKAALNCRAFMWQVKRDCIKG